MSKAPLKPEDYMLVDVTLSFKDKELQDDPECQEWLDKTTLIVQEEVNKVVIERAFEKMEIESFINFKEEGH